MSVALLWLCSGLLLPQKLLVRSFPTAVRCPAPSLGEGDELGGAEAGARGIDREEDEVRVGGLDGEAEARQPGRERGRARAADGGGGGSWW